MCRELILGEELAAVVPTAESEQPYTLLKLGTNQMVKSIKELKNEENTLVHGLRDTGYFCFRARQLFDFLSPMRTDSTGEVGFLSLFAEFRLTENVAIQISTDPRDLLSFNSQGDLDVCVDL